MIKIENVKVMGWEHAIRGMRNPMNSWEKGDSGEWPGYIVDIGPNDHKLMMSLAKGGPVHAKYRRMIVVYADITAPLYWWKEFDTYRIGVEKNSCSTMHKIHEKEFTLEDFSIEHLLDGSEIIPNEEVKDNLDIVERHALENYILTHSEHDLLEVKYEGRSEYLTPVDIFEQYIISALNLYRDKFLETKSKPMKDDTKRAELAKKYWWQMIQLLPSSYNQRRTVMMSYEALAAMHKDRKYHKQDEWREGFCPWIESLPYSEIIIGDKETPDEV